MFGKIKRTVQKAALKRAAKSGKLEELMNDPRIKEKLGGNVSPEQIQMVTALVQKDPELFETIQKETEEEVKKGGNEQMASMRVMMKYKDRVQKVMQEYQKEQMN